MCYCFLITESLAKDVAIEMLGAITKYFVLTFSTRSLSALLCLILTSLIHSNEVQLWLIIFLN